MATNVTRPRDLAAPRFSVPLRRKAFARSRLVRLIWWSTRRLSRTDDRRRRAEAALRERHAEVARLLDVARNEALVAAALGRVGRELIEALGTPDFLPRLCVVTADVLGCDTSHTLLRESGTDAFVLVAGYGATPEEQTIARGVKVPSEMTTIVLSRLRHEDFAQVGTIPAELVATPEQRQTAHWCMALRRGKQIIGLQVANRRGRSSPATETQQRIARGIAQLASLALENARLVDDLERANRLKSDFVATMSHELRTPLNVIIGYGDLLRDEAFGPLTAEQGEVLEQVNTSAMALLRLIDATLDLGRLEAGSLALETHEVDLQTLLRELDAEATALRDKPDVRFAWNLAADLPRLQTDPDKLKLVLQHLIANAVKFTEHGSVTVCARRCDGGVEVCVVDTGIGIAPEVLPIIFEPFRQGESVMTRRYGGIGLGLHVARRLLDLLGGTISVDTTVGLGSTFRVRLPLERT